MASDEGKENAIVVDEEMIASDRKNSTKCKKVCSSLLDRMSNGVGVEASDKFLYNIQKQTDFTQEYKAKIIYIFMGK